jgi:hypothetical protein
VDCATWWFDHVGETYIYVLSARAGDDGTKDSQMEKLLMGAQSWGGLIGVPRSSDLMVEHVVEVKRLADSAFAGERAGVDGAVEALLQNMDKQTDLYAAKIPGFPVDEWKRVFGTYITNTGGYILALAAGDKPDFRTKYNETLQDRNSLARLWGRTCLAMRRR